MPYSKEIEKIKERLIDAGLLGATVYALPALFFSLYRMTDIGWHPIYLVHLAATFCILGLYLFRKKFGFVFKVNAFLLILFAIASFGIVNFKLAGGGYVIFTALVVATLIHGRKKGYLYLISYLAVFSLVAYLHLNGVLNPDIDFNIYLNSSSTWMSAFMGKALFSMVIIYTIGLFYNLFLDTIRSLNDKSVQLERTLGELKLNERRFEAFMEFIPATTYMKDENLNLTYLNNDKNIPGSQEWPDLLNEDSATLSKIKSSEQAILSGESNKLTLEYILDKENKQRWIQDTIFPIYHEDGIKTLGGIAIDISDKKEAERSLIKEKKFIDKVINSLPGMFYVYHNENDALKLRRWNMNMELVTGFAADELDGREPEAFFKKEEAHLITQAIEEVRQKKYGVVEAYFENKEGQRVPYILEGYYFEEDNEEFLVGVGLDISEVKKKESQLVQSEEKFKNIFHSTSDAILIFDLDFNVLSVNNTLLSLLKLDRQMIQGVDIFDYILTPGAKELIKERVGRLAKGEMSSYEYMIRDSAGRQFEVETRGRLISYDGVSAVLVTFNDVSQRKHLEREVYKAAINAEEQERGRIAKELHDGIGPLLSTCLIYLHYVKGLRLDDKRGSVKNMEELIDEALTSIREISNNISPHVLRNFGLFHAVKNFCQRYTDLKIDIDCNCDIETRFDEIYEVTLYRIVSELINNSLKYAQAKQISILFEKKEDNLIMLNYADDGIGFDFERTFRKKKGLGLVNIHSRVNSIGGKIEYASSPGNGVQVKIEVKIN